MTDTLESRVDRLLHDAEHKNAGARFARSLRGIRHVEDAERLERERDGMIAAAIRLDPDRTCDAWQWTDLKLPDQR
ncbi:MAG: hypothetical protein ACJ8AK_02895 [Gemmatimonadaceae bacterium]